MAATMMTPAQAGSTAKTLVCSSVRYRWLEARAKVYQAKVRTFQQASQNFLTLARCLSGRRAVFCRPRAPSTRLARGCAHAQGTFH